MWDLGPIKDVGMCKGMFFLETNSIRVLNYNVETRYGFVGGNQKSSWIIIFPHEVVFFGGAQPVFRHILSYPYGGFHKWGYP